MFDKIDKGMWWDQGVTVNYGCSPVSEGCEHCWAARMAYNYQQYQELTENNNGHIEWTGKTRLADLDIIAKRFSRKKPTAFAIWNDLFHERVSYEYAANILKKMWKAPHHVYILLTKRVNRLLEFEEWHNCIGLDRGCLLTPWQKNVWLGVTAENQKRLDERVPILLQIPVAVRFVSLEPLLERIELIWHFFKEEDYNFTGNFRTYKGRQQVQTTIKAGTKPIIDWVIVGPETGPHRRPCNLEWIESVIEQCRDAGVPCFVKALPINGKISKDMNDWPPQFRVRQIPEVRNDLS